ncbi:MAG: ATP-binding protein [Desulfobacteraceae bacterium]|nr:ATP-binding protein [Desulfobacteraceae bacterium]
MKLQDISAIANDNFYGITADLMSKEGMKEQIIKAFCLADICIEGIILKEKPVDINDFPKFIRADLEKKDLDKLHTLSVKSQHKKYNKDKEEIGIEVLDFDREESDGSKKFFALIGPVLDSLKHGLVLVIDEIDARLHPSLCDLLIGLFNSKTTNKNHAQLIFATHNTLIMNRRMLRRDQIYFVEKDKYGESELYSLLDYKKVRSDASYDKDYLLGKYGAVPYLGNFESFIAGVE